MVFIRSLWVIVLIVPLTACTTYKGLSFVEHTHVGAQIKLDTTNVKPVDVNFGYDRGLVAFVPRLGLEQDAASIISKTDLDIAFATSTTMRNVFATGKAATNLTKAGDRVATFFGECIGVSDTLATQKQTAIKKLTDAQKVKGNSEKLYQEIFPTRSTFMKDESAMFKELNSFVSGVCDQEDADRLGKIVSYSISNPNPN